jgi:hypothetical protein
MAAALPSSAAVHIRFTRRFVEPYRLRVPHLRKKPPPGRQTGQPRCRSGAMATSNHGLQPPYRYRAFAVCLGIPAVPCVAVPRRPIVPFGVRPQLRIPQPKLGAFSLSLAAVAFFVGFSWLC